jgi:hypothetical protein
MPISDLAFITKIHENNPLEDVNNLRSEKKNEIYLPDNEHHELNVKKC